MSIVTQKVAQNMKQDSWYAGFGAYCNGAQLADMPTAEHKRGWWAGLDAQAGAEMPATPRKRMTIEEKRIETDEYEDDIEDREFWRRGEW